MPPDRPHYASPAEIHRSRPIRQRLLNLQILTGSYRAAAELAGCDHHTVARYVKMRAAGQEPAARRHRERAIDAYLPKIEGLVVRSGGRIRGDVVHKRITAMGFPGSACSTRRAVNAAKTAWKAGRRRTYRPWIPEPGRWLQFDWGGATRSRVKELSTHSRVDHMCHHVMPRG